MSAGAKVRAFGRNRRSGERFREQGRISSAAGSNDGVFTAPLKAKGEGLRERGPWIAGAAGLLPAKAHLR